MRLIHYSTEPLTEFHSVPLDKRGARRPMDGVKPAGLWFSDDDDDTNWRSWCEGEHFNLDSYKFAQELTLEFGPMVLHIADDASLLKFSRKYEKQLYPGGSLEWVDWDRVCSDYWAIVITPYLWRLRLDVMWYYAWDCASGCIWDERALLKIGPAVPVKFLDTHAQEEAEARG